LISPVTDVLVFSFGLLVSLLIAFLCYDIVLVLAVLMVLSCVLCVIGASCFRHNALVCMLSFFSKFEMNFHEYSLCL
jgi:uncharacterized protein YacL